MFALVAVYHLLVSYCCCFAFSIRTPPKQHNRPLNVLFTSKSHIQETLQATHLATQLPIFDILEEARQALNGRPNLLLEAPPGAGKTTILPLALLTEDVNWLSTKPQQQHEEGLAMNIIVVEPRRVAARSAAQRMASILQQSTGQTVGYAVRGDSRQNKATTRILVVTEGVLLNRLREDPELAGIDAVVFDEFHERGVGSDTALALCVEVQRSLRPDLRLIVMSATLFEADHGGESRLLSTLGGPEYCNVLVSDGRIYPVKIEWARKGYPPLGVLMKSRKDLVATMCDAIEEALRIAPARGDILAFLPGAREIHRAVQELTTSRLVNAEVLPLYGSMPKEEQDYSLVPSPQSERRVVVSSPIAEASLTLERVTCVVDSGLRRQPRCDVDTGMPRLVTTRCSKASAIQRAGRAGRVQEGLCIRLYLENEYEQQFLDHSPPEILSTDLVPTLLLLSDWGCSKLSDIYDVPFVDPPKEAALKKAYETLVFLQALDESEDSDRFVLTALGRSIAKLPMHPRLATAIMRTNTREALAAALISSFFLDNDMGVRGGKEADLAPRIRAVLEGGSNSFTCKSVLQHAARISEAARDAVLYFVNNPSNLRDVTDTIGESLLPGFIDLLAERKGDASYGGSTYMLSLGRSARLDDVRESPNYAVVAETTTADDGIARIRSFASISSDALYRVAKQKEVVFTVPSRGHEVRARRSLMVGSLELSSTPLPAPSSAEVTKILLDTIRSLGGVSVALIQNLSKDKKAAVEELRERIRLAASTSVCHSKDWPTSFKALDCLEKGDATPDEIKEVEALIEPWLASARSLKAIDMLEVLTSSLSAEQLMLLDRYFPTAIKAPDGTRIPIRYANGVPMAAAKLQQFFGTVESPCVGPQSNPIPVSLSLLSPSGKELAQTIDLPFFWKETYPSVRAEMRGRYAKHPWPEDPMAATPTRQTKKQQLGIAKESGELKKKKKAKKRRR